MNKSPCNNPRNAFSHNLWHDHLWLVHVDPVSMMVEAAVEGPVIVEETLKIQRNLFTFGRGFLKTEFM